MVFWLEVQEAVSPNTVLPTVWLPTVPKSFKHVPREVEITAKHIPFLLTVSNLISLLFRNGKLIFYSLTQLYQNRSLIKRYPLVIV